LRRQGSPNSRWVDIPRTPYEYAVGYKYIKYVFHDLLPCLLAIDGSAALARPSL
jgi:hypothetical protein